MQTLRLVLEEKHFRALVAGKIVEFPHPLGRTPMVIKFGDWCDAKGVAPTMGMVENYVSDVLGQSSVAIILSDIGFAAMAMALDAASRASKPEMTPEEHQRQHQFLHGALDELVVCYFQENMGPVGTLASHMTGVETPLIHLMQWSHQKTLLPSPAADPDHPRSAEDFEVQRKLICLALAELAVSHPESEPAIRALARYYDWPDLQTYEDLKQEAAERKRGG